MKSTKPLVYVQGRGHRPTCEHPDCRGRHCAGGEHRDHGPGQHAYRGDGFRTQNTEARTVTR